MYDDSVSLDKLVSIIEAKLGIDDFHASFIEYSAPLEFYKRDFGAGSKLEFSAQELLTSCNKQDVDDEPLFEDIPDMINELKYLLGDDPLKLVVQQLKSNPNVLACIMKLK